MTKLPTKTFADLHTIVNKCIVLISAFDKLSPYPGKMEQLLEAKADIIRCHKKMSGVLNDEIHKQEIECQRKPESEHGEL